MEKDFCSKKFYSDDERYADLINGLACGGTQVVKKEDLQEMNTQSGRGNMQGFQRKRKPGSGRGKIRDLVRRTAFGINFAVIGIENQEELDYALPLRVMAYDVGEYETQAACIRREIRKRERELAAGEYLYGFTKESRLHPVITFVLYYGEEAWDGSRDLHGLLDFSGIPEELCKLVQNYQVQLVEVRKLTDTSMFRTDIRQVFDFIRCSSDPEKLKQLVESDASYQNMEEDAFHMAALYSSAKELIQIKDVYREGGRINMCKGLEGLIQQGKEEGREVGREQGIRVLIETCQEFGTTKEEAASRIAEKFEIPLEDAENYLVKYWKNQEEKEHQEE